MLIAEAIRNAQKIAGKKKVDAADVRAGLEALNIDAARIKELGLEGFMAPVKVTCDDHSGAHAVYVQQWDGTKWVKASDWIEPMKDKVRPLLLADAKAYAEKKRALAGPYRGLRRPLRAASPRGGPLAAARSELDPAFALDPSSRRGRSRLTRAPSTAISRLPLPPPRGHAREDDAHDRSDPRPTRRPSSASTTSKWSTTTSPWC